MEEYKIELEDAIKEMNTKNDEFFVGDGQLSFDSKEFPIIVAKALVGKITGYTVRHLAKPHEVRFSVKPEVRLISCKEITYAEYGMENDRIVIKTEDHFYRNAEDRVTCLELPVGQHPPEEHPDLPGFHFCHTAPTRLGGYVKVQFERNGRIGYEYRQTDGKKRIVSATREKYEHNMGNMGAKALKEAGTKKNQSVYTKDFGNKVEKAEHQKAEKFVKNLQAAARGKR